MNDSDLYSSSLKTRVRIFKTMSVKKVILRHRLVKHSRILLSLAYMIDASTTLLLLNPFMTGLSINNLT